MRPGATAAAGGNDVDAEACLRAPGGVSSAVVRSEQLDVLVTFPPVRFVLDAVVGEVHLFIEVREVVLACGVADLVLVAARSAVAVWPVAVVVLEELLILAFQVLLEDDAADFEVAMLVSEPGFLLPVRCVKIRVVVDLPGATDADMVSLRPCAALLQGMRVE